MKKIIMPVLILYALAAGHGGKEKPTRYIDNLVVNTSNSYRTVIRKCEPEGIEDMMGLAKNSRLEEAWVYLPEICEWREVGKDETPEKKIKTEYKKSVKPDYKYIKKSMREHDELILYHVHVYSSRPLDDAVKEREQKGNPMSEQEISEFILDMGIQHAIPSASDLACMIWDSKEFYAIKPTGSISYKIGSLYGITEYSLTEEGKKYYLGKDYSTVYAHAEGRHIRRMIRILWDTQPHGPLSEEIIKSCRIMSDEYITVKFTPYSPPHSGKGLSITNPGDTRQGKGL